MTYRVKIRSKPDREHLLLYYLDPITKKEKSRSAETADRGEAERAAARWEEELIEFNGIDGAKWEAFKLRFIDERLTFRSRKTKAAYITALNAFKKSIQVTSLREVDASKVSRFAAELDRQHYPHTTIKSYLTHLKAAFTWAENVGLMRAAPKIQMPRAPKRSHSRGRPLTPREVGKMLRACRKLHPGEHGEWRRLIKLLWYTGLRLGEALALSWDDSPLAIRLDTAPYPLIVIDAEAQKSRADSAVPLAPDAAAWLARTPREARVGKFIDLSNTVGHRFAADKLSARLSEIGQKSGVVVAVNGKTSKYASAHDLRRTFATRWALKVRPLTLQRMMRHGDLSTTLRFYVGLSSADVGAELWQGINRGAF